MVYAVLDRPHGPTITAFEKEFGKCDAEFYSRLASAKPIAPICTLGPQGSNTTLSAQACGAMAEGALSRLAQQASSTVTSLSPLVVNIRDRTKYDVYIGNHTSSHGPRELLLTHCRLSSCLWVLLLTRCVCRPAMQKRSETHRSEMGKSICVKK